MKTAALLLALGAAAEASPKKDPPAAAAFDDRAALDNFAAALAAQKAGTADRPLRISYFGDSLTADDQITNGLRTRLQAQLGDGGAGFVFAAPPHPFCEHRAVTRWVGGGWRVWGISTQAPSDRLLGLGGSAETDDDGVIALAPAGALRSVDVHYLAQPHGGSFDVKADGKVVQTVDTKAADKQSAFAQVSVPDGTKKIRFEAKGKVRLFGATLEAGKGVVVDNLGVVNATAKGMDTNDLPDHLQNQLAHRQADLVVVMYGTNEAEWLAARGAGMEEHERVFGDILAARPRREPQGELPRRVAARSARLARRQHAAADVDPGDGRGTAPRGEGPRLRVLGHVQLDGRQGRVARLVPAGLDRQRLPAPDDRRCGSHRRSAL